MFPAVIGFLAKSVVPFDFRPWGKVVKGVDEGDWLETQLDEAIADRSFHIRFGKWLPSILNDSLLKFALRLKVGKLFLPKTLSQTQLAFTARLGLRKVISHETQRIAQETVPTASGFAMLGQGCPNCWPRGGIVVLHSKEKRATARSNGYSV